MRRSVSQPSRLRALFLHVLGACLFSSGFVVSAQPSGHSMADMQGVPPPEQLPVPLKMNGIGNSHIAIKATPEAQAWFDQGLSLLHDLKKELEGE